MNNPEILKIRCSDLALMWRQTIPGGPAYNDASNNLFGQTNGGVGVQMKNIIVIWKIIYFIYKCRNMVIF